MNDVALGRLLVLMLVMALMLVLVLVMMISVGLAICMVVIFLAVVEGHQRTFCSPLARKPINRNKDSCKQADHQRIELQKNVLELALPDAHGLLVVL
jgi:hypothetical protein